MVHTRRKIMVATGGANERPISVLSRTVVGILLFHTFACGSPSMTPQRLPRVLLAISVTPVTADAQNYSNGQVQFVASGTFSQSPSPGPLTFTPPYTGDFTVSDSSIANIVSTGTASVTVECDAGASGSVNIVATASSNGGPVTNVVGKAQLTCP